MIVQPGDAAAMGAIKDLWQSERGLVAIGLLIASTVLCGTHMITADQWVSYTQWVWISYAAAKTITGAAAMLTSQSNTAAVPASPAVPVVAPVAPHPIPPFVPAPESAVLHT